MEVIYKYQVRACVCVCTDDNTLVIHNCSDFIQLNSTYSDSFRTKSSLVSVVPSRGSSLCCDLCDFTIGLGYLINNQMYFSFYISLLSPTIVSLGPVMAELQFQALPFLG